MTLLCINTTIIYPIRFILFNNTGCPLSTGTNVPSIISFLKPGIIKIQTKSSEEKYYVEDGIVEFKDNNLSILTSSIFNIAEMDKSKKQNLLKQAEIESSKQELNDQTKYLVDQKIEILKTLN